MDPTKLLEIFLGSGSKGALDQAGGAAKRALGGVGNLGGFAGGATVGGLLTLLIGTRKVRKVAGGVVGYGGAAALGALAFKAYQNWQQGRSAASAPAATVADMQTQDQRFLPNAAPAADGQPFELALVRAMIAAAKADGHIDADEQMRLFEQVERLGLDAESKAFVLDALAKPMRLEEIASAPKCQEQASELYLASRLAIDPDDEAERAYLQALARRLKLPTDLVAHLDRQAESGLATARN